MIQYLPFKPGHFATWVSPKPLPVIPSQAAITPSRSKIEEGSSNILLFVGLGVLAIAVIAVVYSIQTQSELNFKISAISSDLKELSALNAPKQTEDNLVTIDKSNDHGSN